MFLPPFKAEFDDDDNDAMINAASPDVVWFGMTAPKQEKWVYANRDKVDAAFLAPARAVFDFFTGRIKRSQPVFQRMGLEWLPRLIQEPRRLWQRSLVSGPKFL